MLLPRLQEWLTRFTAIIVTAFPLMVLGVLAYAIIERVISRERVLRLVPRHPWLAIPVAALLGIVLPVCDCGVVPTARALVRRELGLAPALAFLIGAPVINPIVFFATAVGFGFNYTIAVARLALTFVVAVTVAGLATLAFGETALDALLVGGARAPSAPALRATTVAQRGRAASAKRRARQQQRPLPPWLHLATDVAAEAGDQLLDLGRFLVLGALIAAAVQTFVPQSPLLALSQNVLASTVALMALASILSICSISDAPVAFSFLGTFAPGAVFAFMLFGQIFDLKNAAMLLATFRQQVVVFLVVSSALVVLALGTLINLGVL
ncbi:MAG: permease [Ktedonobacterales bacterium]|nr:permease [Ktedonobacterales bacterium]